MNKYNELAVNYYHRMGGAAGLGIRAVVIITVVIITLLLLTNDCNFKIINEMAVWGTECF